MLLGLHLICIILKRLLRMFKGITIACSKGYLWDNAISLLNQMDIVFDSDLSNSRQLSIVDQTGCIKLMKVRPWDVPVYLEEGAADLGIVGKDVLIEQQANVYELQDLRFGGCRLVIAGPEELKNDYLSHNIRVATKYEFSTLRYFMDQSIRCIPIKMYGAMELAPLTGVADIICDLTATGKTLIENGLIEYDEVFSSTARLISNKVSFLTKSKQINEINKKMQSLLQL